MKHKGNKYKSNVWKDKMKKNGRITEKSRSWTHTKGHRESV